MSDRKRICIDLSIVTPGRGGAGGGVATYALNLIRNLDRLDVYEKYDIICLRHPSFTDLNNLRNVQVFDVSVNKANVFSRLVWLNISLPIFCIKNRIGLLHRVIPEMPLFKACEYVCTLHDYMFEYYLGNSRIRKYLSVTEKLKFKYFKTATRYATRICSRVIVPSKAIADESVRYSSRNFSKYSLIHEAADITVINERRNKDKDKKFVFGVVAGFYPHKGHFFVLRLISKLVHAGFTDFEIHFRGNPAYPKYIHQLKMESGELGLEKYIRFVPFAKNSSLMEIYNSFDALLLLSEYEGFGLPVLEAQAFRLPVICSDIAVFKELLGNSAFYLPITPELQDITDLIRFISNDEAIDAIVKKGVENLSRFSWLRMAQHTANLYNDILVS